MKSYIPVIFALFSLVPLSLPAQAPAASAAATTESPAIRELQKVEDSWSTALNNRDEYGLELVLSPLFVNVAANGDVNTRNQQVANLLSEQDKNAVTDMRVVTVRMLGDVAVANGTYAFTHKVEGHVVEEKGVFTHVFQRQHGNWLCLNAQRTAVREETPGKPTKAKSNSKADLPFHIPLFSRGDKATDKPNQ